MVAVQRLIAKKEEEMKKETEKKERQMKAAGKGPKKGIKKHAPVFPRLTRPKTSAEIAKQVQLAEEGLLAQHLAEQGAGAIT